MPLPPTRPTPTDERLQLLTVKQVASYLAAPVPFVRALLRSGELRGCKIGKQWRVTTQDLCEFIIRRVEEQMGELESTYPNRPTRIA